ncbi:hypothetical protein [Enterococcus wangshanyuanii]|uniref:Uncharacterized protein n=1 Tax=Enterococcus wangshanyuanii TaxID=2005703 RepID=A0ABQ1PUC7_9ENTE|nr:hypothetical protein [Enterococcus wangshanyuanii]GGD03546.1 hypothetical protein GCM10011573_36250 [Enterococcus wangshanyuanii]
MVYIVEEKYPEDLNIEAFETRKGAKEHADSTALEIVKQLIKEGSGFTFEYDEVGDFFQIQSNDEENEIIVSISSKELKK